MKLKQFVRYVITSALAIFSCVQFSSGLSHDLSIGHCTDMTGNRSIPMLTQVVAKNNNKWFSSFRKTDITLRFPRVRVFSIEFLIK